MKVSWQRRAVADVVSAVTFVQLENPAAAAALRDRFDDSGRQIGRFPNMGRPGRMPGTREMVVSGTPHILVYRVEGETIQLIRVMHGARRYGPHNE